jgi:hypothetical protein
MAITKNPDQPAMRKIKKRRKFKTGSSPPVPLTELLSRQRARKMNGYIVS